MDGSCSCQITALTSSPNKVGNTIMSLFLLCHNHRPLFNIVPIFFSGMWPNTRNKQKKRFTLFSNNYSNSFLEKNTANMVNVINWHL